MFLADPLLRARHGRLVSLFADPIKLSWCHQRPDGTKQTHPRQAQRKKYNNQLGEGEDTCGNNIQAMLWSVVTVLWSLQQQVSASASENAVCIMPSHDGSATSPTDGLTTGERSGEGGGGRQEEMFVDVYLRLCCVCHGTRTTLSTSRFSPLSSAPRPRDRPHHRGWV